MCVSCVCVWYFTLCFRAKPTCDCLLRETKCFHFMCVLLKLSSISHTDINEPHFSKVNEKEKKGTFYFRR